MEISMEKMDALNMCDDCRDVPFSLVDIHFEKTRLLQICIGDVAVDSAGGELIVLDDMGMTYKYINTPIEEFSLRILEQYETVLVSFDYLDSPAFDCVLKLLPILKESDSCIVGVCCDWNDEGVVPSFDRFLLRTNAKYEEECRPIEFRCAEFMRFVDMLIFVQLFAEHGPQCNVQLSDAICTFLSMWIKDKRGERLKLLKEKKGTKIAYYHHVECCSKSSIRDEIKKVFIDTFLSCPYYVARSVFCDIVYGKNVKLFDAKADREKIELIMSDCLPGDAETAVYFARNSRINEQNLIFRFLFFDLDFGYDLSAECNAVNEHAVERLLRQRQRIGKFLINYNER